MEKKTFLIFPVIVNLLDDNCVVFQLHSYTLFDLNNLNTVWKYWALNQPPGQLHFLTAFFFSPLWHRIKDNRPSVSKSAAVLIMPQSGLINVGLLIRTIILVLMAGDTTACSKNNEDENTEYLVCYFLFFPFS